MINKHGDHTRYTYDGFGNRVKMIIDLKETGQGRGQNNGNNGNNGNPGNKGGNGNHYGWENGNNGNNGNEGNPGNKGGNGNHYGWENGNNGNPGNKGGNGNHYGWENGNQGNNGRNPKPGWDHQFKRDYIETHFVVDLTSPYNSILMSYGEQSQIQRYTYGLDLISMDFQSLSDHDNGWIPRGTETTYSGQFEGIYYLLDELGSTARVIGENGKSSAHYNYDEFGRPLPEIKFDPNWPGPDNTIAYTGYEYDRYAELYYAQARYYLPEIGRFISEDSWGGSLAVPNTMNPYPYVLNNPLKYVDPLGLTPVHVNDGGGGRATVNPTKPTGQGNTKSPSHSLTGSAQYKGEENKQGLPTDVTHVIDEYEEFGGKYFVYPNGVIVGSIYGGTTEYMDWVPEDRVGEVIWVDYDITDLSPKGLGKVVIKTGQKLLSKKVAKNAVKGTGEVSCNGALNQTKRDAGIPRSQQPEAVNRVDVRSAQHEGGHVIKDSKGKVISTREYVYTYKDGKKIVIQDHSAGHAKGGQGPHFNVRPADNTRTGKVPGTKEHYPFKE